MFYRTINGKPISNFVGIPYAKPPVGPLRFKKSEPVEPWSGLNTLQAKKMVTCVQVNKSIFLIDPEYRLNLGKSSEMIIFVSLLTTFEQ